MSPRPAALTAAVALVLGLLVATAPAAQAAWGTQQTFHGAKVQLCKVRGDGYHRIRVRLDNRRGKHTHHGSVGRTRDNRYHGVIVRARAGKVSATKSIVYRSGDQLDWGGGEGEGINFGDAVRLGRVPRC